MALPARTRGWANPRRNSLEGDQGHLIAEILDDLAIYLNGDLYASGLTVGGNVLSFTYDTVTGIIQFKVNGTDAFPTAVWA